MTEQQKQQAQERVAKTMRFYLSTAFVAAGLRWGDDSNEEVNSMVEDIFAGIPTTKGSSKVLKQATVALTASILQAEEAYLIHDEKELLSNLNDAIKGSKFIYDSL